MNGAFIRIRGSPDLRHKNFRKNVRKLSVEKENESGVANQGRKRGSSAELEEQTKQFARLMELAGKLLDLGYVGRLAACIR